MGEPLIAALSELAARVQRGRTTDQVLEIAGGGVDRLGMRLAAFQIVEDVLVLRYVATAPKRMQAIESMLGRPLFGLRAPLAKFELVREVIDGRQNIYREDLDVFDQFLRKGMGIDLSPLDASPATAGIPNGVLAPLFVADRPWGLLCVVSPTFRADDAAAVQLFATHVGSAIEAAEFIEELVKQQQLASLGELAAIVAHEVRNPLGVIFNSVALLRKMLHTDSDSLNLRDDGEQLLTVVAEEAERLNRIVSDLLDFARPQHLNLERASLGKIANDVLASASKRPDAARIEFKLDIPPDIAPVDMDVRLVRQALLNLIVNGIQAMPGGGTLTVRGRIERPRDRDRSFARVDVIDTGTGIAADAEGRVFEPFFTTKAAGTGLGLALVKRVVESHGGEITLDTSPCGTTFTLRVPVDAVPASGRFVVRSKAAARATWSRRSASH